MLARLMSLVAMGFLFVFALGLAEDSAHARNYALLVGVSNYPNLDQKFQLSGPDNDVKLMGAVLQKLQVKQQDIHVLFSANKEKPTKANIVAGLRALAAKTGPDDFVYLFFAGHGSRQPARAGDIDEEDNLDEIFLPEDVGSWKDEIGTVERSITDNEIKILIDGIRANGTFVWAVFDSCHSGTMLRSVSRIKWRKVAPSALGIPRDAVRRKRPGNAPSLVEQSVGGSRSGSGKPGGFVAFYAAQSHQLAPELKMPPHSSSPSAHGLFTYQLAQAMMAGSGLTYRQLGQFILQKYVKQGMRATTPLFEGTHLDAPMFGTTNKKVRNQWPVRIKGSRNKTLFVPAGELQQIGKGTLFALLGNVSDPDDQAVGYAVADHVELFGARLLPVAHGDQKAFDLAVLPRSSYARVIQPQFRFSLRVARPKRSQAQTDRERRLVRAIDAVAHEGQDVGAKRGLRIDWVEAGRDADIHLAFSPPRSLYAKLKDVFNPAKGCERNHLWFLDPSGAMICSGPRANLSFKIGNPSANFDKNVKKALHDWLNTIGKVRNLEQMVERFKGGRFARRLNVKLLVKRAGGGVETVVDQSSRQPLREGDAIRLEIRNGASSPVDLTVLFVDSRYGITTLFPTGGRTNRISAKANVNHIGGNVTSDTLGLEGMIVIASKADTGSPVADFSFLSQQKLKQTKNVRSLSGASRKPYGQTDAIEDLFASAAFGRRCLAEPGQGLRVLSRVLKTGTYAV